MASENSQPEKQPASTAVDSHASSCRKHRDENATFFEDVKDHIHDFIHASLDDHKTCFKKGIQKVDSSFTLLQCNLFCNFVLQLVLTHVFYYKMFGMSKVVAERSSEVKEVESSLHLSTTVSK